MAQPNVRGLIVAGPLPQVSLAYRNGSYIGDRVFPVINNCPPDALITRYLKGAWFRDEAGVRAPGTRAARGGFDNDYIPIHVAEYAFAQPVTDEDRRYVGFEGAPPLQPDIDAVEFATDKIDLKKERRVAALVFGGTWSGVAGGQNLGGSWEHGSSVESSACTFVNDVETQIETIRMNTGLRPNVLMISANTLPQLKEEPTLLNRIKYTEKGIITANLIASLFGLEEVLVGFRHGLILNSGEALERLAEADTVVFDKTGTLTRPRPVLANAADIDPADLALAGALALVSRHPLARAIAEASGAKEPIAAEESSGEGVEALWKGESVRLGSVAWCGAEAEAAPVAAAWPDASLIALRRAERAAVFTVRQELRPDAGAAVADIARSHPVEILSGDREPAVAFVARELGVARFEAGMKPADKISRLKALAEAGRRPLMVGDGLNDAPALAAAHVSISPISAAYIAQAQADAVFLGERLMPVADALRISAKARRLMVENLWLSAAYNMVAVPLAVLGFVTPLIAALAMSGSSILVTLNALRARDVRRKGR